MITDKDREEIISLLSGNYSCGRTWSAWQYGTMQEDDFAPLDEDDSFIDDLLSVVDRIRAESAEQARKEAAERAVEFIRDQGMEQMEMWDEYDDNRLRDAILGDSVVKENLITDHIPDTVEKLHPEITNEYVKKLEDDLAIAVKALEKINERHSFADIVDDSYIISRDALKEIQG